VSSGKQEKTLKTSDFSFDLPSELIAQHPAPTRDASRLLVADRSTNQRTHQYFRDLPQFLKEGDVLVMNNSRVIPARLRGQKIGGEAAVELLLTERSEDQTWWSLLRPGKRLPQGSRIALFNHHGQPSNLTAEIVEKNDDGHARVQFTGTNNLMTDLEILGEMPLPPYIQREPFAQETEDIERYQTVYASSIGSIAAPTAGLHFTEALIGQLQDKGVEIHYVTLHVGLGTFSPVKSDELDNHRMHAEHFTLTAATSEAINRAKNEGRRVIAVGTTTVRVLESVAQSSPAITETSGTTNIFIYPPQTFKVVDALITNFHLPQSSLLMLVSAFGAPGETHGREWVLEIYAEAVREKYRFFSYGDAMLIT